MNPIGKGANRVERTIRCRKRGAPMERRAGTTNGKDGWSAMNNCYRSTSGIYTYWLNTALGVSDTVADAELLDGGVGVAEELGSPSFGLFGARTSSWLYII